MHTIQPTHMNYARVRPVTVAIGRKVAKVGHRRHHYERPPWLKTTTLAHFNHKTKTSATRDRRPAIRNPKQTNHIPTPPSPAVHGTALAFT